jgi:hypothetical protein
VKARCWFEEEPRVDFIRNIAPWDADDLDADRSRGLRLDSERPLIKVLLTAAFGRRRELAAALVTSHLSIECLAGLDAAQ